MCNAEFRYLYLYLPSRNRAQRWVRRVWAWF